MSRAYHHGDLKRALVDAALALMREDGIDAVTMSKVATRSGVSSGAPYRHFKDRQELLRACCIDAVTKLGARLEHAAADAPTALEGFRRTGVEYVRFAVEDPVAFRLISRWDLMDRQDVPEDNASRDRAFVDGLEALLGSEPVDAPLDADNPVIQQLAARCMMHGLSHFFVDGNLAVLGIGPDQAGRIADALTRALGSPHHADRFNIDPER